ncbi:hypothetical protein [Flavobacterium cellulosilyticum]|uniref:DUF4595 domain-containing protein n=1 Tax=Flavobacterium cellulosilyticum TaxID=2541731 RepID=A0A4R5CK69_9FLAO|nr:hypothetical protein [Flavobacterium cellulosilyticum]TDD97814.1 hypothetical protein E0F76_06850 [Flavobacterium cellulosilyticum]
MKKLKLVFTLSIVLTQLSFNSVLNNHSEMTNQKASNKMVADIPANYHLQELNVINYGKEEFKQNVVFKYNEDNTIKERIIKSESFTIIESYEYKNGFISKIHFDNSDPKLSAITLIDYKGDEISSIRILRKSVTNSDVYEESPCIAELTHFTNKIEKISSCKDGRLPTVKATIVLNNNGNFLYKTSDKSVFPNKTYDDKINPNNLVYPKYLLGYYEVSSGNVLTEGIDINYEYKYNSFGLPIEMKKMKANVLIEKTEFIYK